MRSVGTSVMSATIILDVDFVDGSALAPFVTSKASDRISDAAFEDVSKLWSRTKEARQSVGLTTETLAPVATWWFCTTSEEIRSVREWLQSDATSPTGFAETGVNLYLLGQDRRSSLRGFGD